MPRCSTYLDFVRDPANGFATGTLPLGDGIEYSVKLQGDEREEMAARVASLRRIMQPIREVS